jgi:hypothetical protein
MIHTTNGPTIFPTTGKMNPVNDAKCVNIAQVLTVIPCDVGTGVGGWGASPEGGVVDLSSFITSKAYLPIAPHSITIRKRFWNKKRWIPATGSSRAGRLPGSGTPRPFYSHSIDAGGFVDTS